jgi:hypothetical protein
MGEWNDGFCLAKYFCSYLQVIFKCRKILRHGASGFISPLREGVLWIFVALKNPSPLPGLNPRTLGPIASTLTITPPRETKGRTWVEVLENCPEGNNNRDYTG